MRLTKVIIVRVDLPLLSFTFFQFMQANTSIVGIARDNLATGPSILNARTL
jgi:hypothetical protein